MTTTTRRRAGLRVSVLAVGLAALLAGCSAAGGSEAGDEAAPAPADGSVGGEADGGGDGTGNDGAPAQGAQGSPVSVGTTTRQVIVHGQVILSVKDPRSAVDDVITIVEGTGGRVDARHETAGSGDAPGSADLTVRIPSSDLSAALDDFEDVGKVVDLQLDSQDVTGDVQDLDARIKALQLSVGRMEDLLARATTNKDLIEAEQALSDRQAQLESLQSQRARVHDEVALATLEVSITTPGLVPAAEPHGPHGFLDALAVGWQSLVVMLRGLVVVLGVLLPWLVFGGLIAAAAVSAVRWARRRRNADVVVTVAPDHNI